MKALLQKQRIHAIFLFLFLFAAFSAVSVSAAPKLQKTSLTLKLGNAYVLRLNGNTDWDDVTWKSSAPKNVAVVSKHNNRVVLQAKKKGKAVISARIDGRTLRCKVTVKKNAVYPTRLTLRVGDKFSFRTSKKASWLLSDQQKGTLSATSGKKSVFVAKKAGKVKVLAFAKKNYTCTVDVIRKDGATKADLDLEAYYASLDDEDDDDEDDDEDDNADEGYVTPVSSLTAQQKGLFASLAASACGNMLGSNGVDIAPCSFHNMDLDDNTRAFLLYEYIYKYLRVFTTEADVSVSEYDGYRYISPESLSAMCTHLFGEGDHTKTLNTFIQKYVDFTSSGYYVVSAAGDFGDVGLYYFEQPASVTRNHNMFCATGAVKVWNSYMQAYVDTYTYQAYWYERTQARTAYGVDRWFQFESVVVE